MIKDLHPKTLNLPASPAFIFTQKHTFSSQMEMVLLFMFLPVSNYDAN
jgi:hypothetical protein